MRRGEKLHIIIVLSVAAAAALTSGCVRRSLEYKPSQFPDGEGLVEVTMVWPEGVQPDSARLYFYHVDGSVLRVHEGLTEYFYSGTMPEGDYPLKPTVVPICTPWMSQVMSPGSEACSPSRTTSTAAGRTEKGKPSTSRPETQCA